ncbi:phosphatase PAP2 family protein [Corynebacterium genitalium ATCC 33030]|uniref:PAP2 family protein n=1 Tax=Corynebacterium genitalium ATCC 33030 TaxID=585529 RepID=D7WCA3_9CORY|nr:MULTISPECIES: phosphatase PAP2 family protein [Corynebacterium]MCQ4618401.1 phosphatase PAP2 family protein [Corynebacterium pseudogenitalium]EFK54732.1 PAP2 family protein [Corynebacterium genitalium ATCC 33030]MCQ4621088.1 phosphatase PAP2 family protein [Corynebacterium sp. CCUG 71335]MCQ4623173.1 phosphatase PAP2 family protein [Corynebacterium sp. CCUG 70398]MCQ4625477.1 phosphatase PAP2 family protein [Corynebacterium sp. CCUG 69979]
MKRLLPAIFSTALAVAVPAVSLTAAPAHAQPLGHVNFNLPPNSKVTVPQLRDPNTGSSTGQVPREASGAPQPVPFSPDYLAGYISDISPYQYGIYAEVNRLFPSLRDNRPDVMDSNLQQVIAINNAASSDPELVRRAQVDAVASSDELLVTLSEGLGEEFGKQFRDALREGRLPKTQYLLGNGYLARSGGIASSTFAEKQIFNYNRPHVVAPDRIKRYNPPGEDLYLTSKSFPSGHTNQAALVTSLLAYMVPEAAPQLHYRGAEAGHSRIVLGVHYPLDVIGGRMSGQAAAADRLNDPKMRNAFDQAAAELRAEMQWRTGKSIPELVASDKPYVPTATAVEQTTKWNTYDFKPIYRTDAPMIVPQAAPTLIAASFPELNYHQRAQVIAQTATAPGNPLDWQAEGGSWQRVNLAAATSAKVNVNQDGSVTVLR